MLYLWIDDVRPFPYSNWETNGQTWFSTHTTNEAVNFIRQEYKKGNASFYLDIDHDAGDYVTAGGDYINILKNLETYVNTGKMRHLKITCHFHSMNPVGIMNMKAICEKNGWEVV